MGVWLLQQQSALPELNWLWLLLLIPLGLRQFSASSSLISHLAIEVSLKIIFLMLGFLFAAWMAQVRLSDVLPKSWEGKDIELIGVVSALPQLNETGARFEFDTEHIITPGAHVPRHIQLSWFADGFENKQQLPATKVHAGERWQLTVRLNRPHGNVNPFGFDYESWLLEKNIRATGSVYNADSNRRLQELVPHPGYLAEYVRERIAQRLNYVLTGLPYAAVLSALAIGDQSAVPQSQWQVFIRTGVNHLMSISGLHVTMVSGLVFSLTYWLWKQSYHLLNRLPARKAALLAGVLTALCYALLTGFAVPAQRTVYMLAVVAAALWAGSLISISVVLCLALLAVTLLDPWAVLSPGFWLSFGAVAIILYVSAGRIGKPHWLRESLNTQWAVTLGLIPALLVLFQQVSLISPVANAFAIPVISLVVVPLTLIGIIPGLDFLLLAAHAVMDGCMHVLTYLSALPDAVWQQHAPVLWTVPLAMIAILWMLLPRGFPARWLGLIGVLPVFLVVPPAPQAGALWLTVLDVGQGLAVVARTANHALLYDTGPGFNVDADSGNRVILPYLRGAGVSKLDAMIVSHNDLDHSGGAISVLDGVPVNWMISSLPDNSPILLHARKSSHCVAGQSWQWDGVRFDVLHPMRESYADEGVKDNDRSCVIKITSRYGSALLPADIESVSEQELLDRIPRALSAHVLVAPHHGSKTSSTEEFVRQVNPFVTIFTAGYRNRYGHPKQEIVKRYEALGGALYRSDQSGAVEFRFENTHGFTTAVYRHQHHRYWWD